MIHTVLGLLHTFAGDSCEDGLFGDGVADTPQHRRPDPSNMPNNYCPTQMDSCGSLPGSDPAQNYMTYSRDNTCRTHFTVGQIERMEYQWHLHRATTSIESPSSLTNRPSTTPPNCAGMFGGCEYNDCCGRGNCWRGLFWGLLPDFCFL
jgi:hypothetical protein